jgi:CBS domain-containing protein
MAAKVREVMTARPVGLPKTSALTDAARTMRDEDIGDVLVMDGDRVCGVVTDRDIVIRALAQDRAPGDTTLDDICSHELVCASPDQSVNDAARLMREHAVRRLPVVEDGRPIGVVTIGDLAIEQDPGSALADISAAPPDE